MLSLQNRSVGFLSQISLAQSPRLQFGLTFKLQAEALNVESRGIHLLPLPEPVQQQINALQHVEKIKKYITEFTSLEKTKLKPTKMVTDPVSVELRFWQDGIDQKTKVGGFLTPLANNNTKPLLTETFDERDLNSSEPYLVFAKIHKVAAGCIKLLTLAHNSDKSTLKAAAHDGIFISATNQGRDGYHKVFDGKGLLQKTELSAFEAIKAYK